MTSLSGLRINIFADGADLAGILDMARDPRISGFTTNPTLMRKAGVEDYEAFARDVLAVVRDRPVSFEVFSDELDEMVDQARYIASWGRNVVVKIPITNTRGEPTLGVLELLSSEGVRLNVTAVMTVAQARAAAGAAASAPLAYISVFAGRIADTGRDPMPLMSEALEALRPFANAQLLWASPRELLNIFQADSIGCHVITASNDILNKLSLVGKDLDEFSLETVKMFHDDARKVGYALRSPGHTGTVGSLLRGGDRPASA